MSLTMQIVFSKEGLMRYISHLDLLRLFGRALRRANVPFAISEGFSKHPKIVIKRALKLGIESQEEEAEFRMRGDISPEKFTADMQRQLPDGIRIKRCIGISKSGSQEGGL